MHVRVTMSRMGRPGFRLHWAALAMLVGGALGVHNASATSAGWTGLVNGNWDNTGNWTATPIPGSADTATFSNSVNTSISLNGADRQLRSIVFSAAAGSFTFGASGAERLLLTSGGSIILGASMSGAGITETFNVPIVLGGNYSFTDSRIDASCVLVFNGNITNSATSTLSLNGSGTGTSNKIAGVISDGVGVMSVSASQSVATWELSGANTFSGPLTNSSGGTLILSGSNSSGGSTVFLNGILVLASAANGGLAGGPLTLSSADVRGNDATSTRTVTNALFLGGTINVGDAVNSADLVFKGNGVLTTNVTLSMKSTAAFEGSLSGDYYPSRTSAGALFLLGQNTFGGQPRFGSAVASLTIINSLTSAGLASSVGTNAMIALGDSNAGQTAASPTLRYIGGPATSDRSFDVIGNATTITVTLDSSGYGPLILNGNVLQSGVTGTTSRIVYFSGVNTGANTFAGSTSNGVTWSSPAAKDSPTAVRKSGCGTWVLSGANGFTNGLQVYSGRLVLDYASNATVVSTNNKVILDGGTLELKGRSGAFNTVQALGAVVVTDETGMHRILLNRNGGNGVALANGVFSLSTLHALLYELGDVSNTVAIGTSELNPDGRVLIKDGTGRYDWVRNTGNNTAIFAVNATNDLIANPAGADYRLTGSFTVTNNQSQLRTLRIDPGTDNQTLTLTQSNSATNNRLSAIMLVGDKNFTIAQTAGQTGGLGDAVTPATKALIYHFGTGKLTLNALLAGSSGGGTGSIEFFGTGLIDWIKAPNSSGKVMIGGVTLRQGSTAGQLLSNTGSGLGSGNILLSDGAVLEGAGGVTITRDVSANPGGIKWVNDGGFSAYGGTCTVRLNNGSGSIIWGSTSFVGKNDVLVLSSTHSDSTTDFQNGLDFANGQRVVSVNNGTADVDAKLSGVLSGGYGSGLIKRGAGTLELTGANTYPGDTWVEEGTLRVSGTTGSGLVTVSGGASISGTGTVNRLTLKSGGKLVVYDTGSGVASKLNITGAFNMTGGVLDLSGLLSPAHGDQVIAECGALDGASFSAINGLPSNRQIIFRGNRIVLRDATGGFLLRIY